MKPVARHFLGGDQRFVVAAANWVREGNWTAVPWLVVSSRRGGRILSTRLSGVEHRLLTIGELPDVLAGGNCASRLQRQAAWWSSLSQRREAEPAWHLAWESVETEDELGSHGLTWASAAERLAEQVEPSAGFFTAQARAAAEVSRQLANLGVSGPAELRLSALEKPRTIAPADIVLVGVLDLAPITERLLVHGGHRVSVLIPTSESHQMEFDPWGRIAADRPCRDDSALLRFAADDVHGEVEELADQVAAASGRRTISVPDRSLLSAIERELSVRKAEFHLAAGRNVADCGPARFLRSLAETVREFRFDSLGLLIREPAFEMGFDAQLDATTAPESRDREIRGALRRRDWLTILDRYSEVALPRRFDAEPPGDGVGAWLVIELRTYLDGLLGPFEQPRSLAEWSRVLGGVLAGLVEQGGDQPEEPGQRELLDLLEEQAQLGALASAKTDLGAAIEITLNRARRQNLASGAGQPEVEVVGWLDALLDDAPSLWVVGVNEGSLPEPIGTSGGLSLGVRRALDLEGDEERLRRDAAFLEALGGGRSVTMMSARLNRDGEPLVPSRLLLQGDGESRARRLREFYGQVPGRGRVVEMRSDRTPSLVAPSAVNPLTSLAVTAFGTYLRCPYRFYLRHVMGLSESRDRSPELSPREFGNLAHEVVRRSSHEDAIHSTASDTLVQVLRDELSTQARARLGDRPPIAARLQLSQLGKRLEAFALWQCEQNRSGWRVVSRLIEKRVAETLDVDGVGFGVRGRLDRVDHHDRLGWRVLDYKTGERGDGPDRVHFVDGRRGAEWRDLQLPLYAWAARRQGLEGALQVGYLLLGRDLKKSPLLLADWEDEIFDAGLEAARQVVRRIRDGVFWPPSDPPGHRDEMARILVGWDGTLV